MIIIALKPIYTHKPKKYDTIKDVNKIEGAYCLRKYDGQSLQIIFDSGNIKIYANSPSKVAKVFNEYTNSLTHIINELKQININHLHLQGEVYSDHLPTEKQNFDYTCGVIKDHNSYERQLKEGLVKFVVYDIPSHGNLPYRDRYSYMQTLFNDKDFKYVSLAPILGINENGNWKEYFNQMIEQGREGIVLYAPDGVYKYSENSNGRNPSMWKIKVHSNGDKEVMVTEILEGKGKDANTIGKLKCIDGNGKEFKIGSFAINDEERKWIYDNCTPPFLVEMSFMEETSKSYRHTVMTRLRLDKSVDDWNPE